MRSWLSRYPLFGIWKDTVFMADVYLAQVFQDKSEGRFGWPGLRGYADATRSCAVGPKMGWPDNDIEGSWPIRTVLAFVQDFIERDSLGRAAHLPG
jgi:hypothetical protein